jgi:hypothetical protein
MNKQYYVIFVFLTIIAGGALVAVFHQPSDAKRVNADTPTTAVKGQEDQRDQKEVHLYFTDGESTYLRTEVRRLLYSTDPVIFGKRIIEALINGPHDKLVGAVPKETVVRALYVTPDKIAYLDLSHMIQKMHPGGTRLELITIFSMVNSLVLNMPEIDAVKIVIQGREADTMAGHVDLRQPFKANMLMIR